MDPGSLIGTKFKKLKEICTQVHLCENVKHQRQKNKHSKVVREKKKDYYQRKHKTDSRFQR